MCVLPNSEPARPEIIRVVLNDNSVEFPDSVALLCDCLHLFGRDYTDMQGVGSD